MRIISTPVFNFAEILTQVFLSRVRSELINLGSVGGSSIRQFWYDNSILIFELFDQNGEQPFGRLQGLRAQAQGHRVQLMSEAWAGYNMAPL